MLFSSVLFVFYFLPAVLLVYFLVPRCLKNAWLLFASLTFYTWGEPLHWWVLVGSVALNYAAAFLVSPESGGKHRPWFLGATIFLNLAMLAWFKYSGFITANWNQAASLAGWNNVTVAQMHLPLGISFFTFQAISYVVDVYRGTTPAQRRLDHYALYACLFPHLLAGPIVRYVDLAGELSSRKVDVLGFASGMKRFILGLAKKVLIANQIATFVDEQFSIPASNMTSGVAWMSVLGYGLQIYCDFSAYSDMAIGLGRMFGFHFRENFDHPYCARSVRDFWRRWHISLSSWFRDYVYIPLGGSRHGLMREHVALLSVFFLCGLWHGAKWNFILWGCWHGLHLLLERQGWGKIIARLWQPLQHVYTLGVVFAGWILFRCQDLPDTLSHIKAMAGFGGSTSTGQEVWYYLTPLNLGTLVAGLLVAASPWRHVREWLERTVSTRLAHTGAVRGGLEVFGLLVLLILSVSHLAAITYNPFIYFRF
ncbi:MBOAT family protein [soil metagenome]